MKIIGSHYFKGKVQFEYFVLIKFVLDCLHLLLMILSKKGFRAIDESKTYDLKFHLNDGGCSRIQKRLELSVWILSYCAILSPLFTAVYVLYAGNPDLAENYSI